MKKDSPKNLSCEFAPEIIDFLYGEMNGEQKNAFNQHLRYCSDCAAEIEDFSGIRFSITEWKAAEFDRMATPQIVIPYKTSVVKTVATENVSFFDSIKSYLTLSPVFSGAAAVLIIAVLIGFGIFVFNKNGKNDLIASKNNNTKIINQAAASPQKTVEQIVDTIESAGKETENKESVNDKEIQKDAERPEQIVPVRTNNKSNPKQKSLPVKVSEKKSSVIEPSLNSSKNPKAVPNKNKPRLNELPEEDEDNSLRLSDLFAELDTRE